jgi:hypothetical protein
MKVMSKILLCVCCVFLIGLISYADVKAEDDPPLEEQEIVDAVETAEKEKITTVIIEKASELKEWIVALVIAFIGSSSFFGLVYAIVKKVSDAAKLKIKELEKEAKLSKEQAEAAQKCLAELTEKVEKVYMPALEKSVTIIQDYLEVDKKKTDQVNDLLERIVLPGLNQLTEGKDK